LEQVLTWVESEPDALVHTGEFRVVQKWPGHCRELGPPEASETLASLGFGRQEALFLQHLSSEAGADAVAEDVAMEEPPSSAESKPSPGHGAWSQAEEKAHAVLDRRLEGQGTPTAAAANEPELSEIRGEELVAVFERLVALGMQPPKAAAASKRFAAQLKELGEMGFENWIDAVELLEKYNGRLLRVANLLTERAIEGHDTLPAVAPPAPPVPAASAPTTSASAPSKQAPPVDKERVTAKFKELVAGGMIPDDAASQAILAVRQEMAAEAPAAAVSVPPTGAIQEKLQELLSMGFADEARNKALLTKYGGRIERVIEALCN